MSFGGFGSSSAPTSGGFGSFGSGGTSSGFGSSAAASPFGGGTATSGFGSGTSTFGAGAAKPTFGGFGATAPTTGGGFGAPQTSTTGFGGFGTATTAPSTGFGATANPATTGGFGSTSAFGGGATTGGFGASGTSAFGASTPFGAKPATSPSPFGSTGAFGGSTGTTSAFGGGGGGATTGSFGTPTPASGGMFGNTGTGGFGAPAVKSPFGATSTTTTGGFGAQTTGQTGFGGFGSQPATVTAPAGQVQVGTGQPPYQPTREMEASGTGGTANYISISRMPAYAHKSTEELRYEDYLKRTDPAAAQAAATQNAPAPGATSGGSGAFGAFGAQPATSSAFGTTGGFGASQPSAFGAPSAGGGFGSSAFGSATTGSTTGGFGGFGSQPAAATSGGMFGNTTARPATGTFGAPTTNSAFGAAPGAASAFGAPATGGGFGAATGGFGNSFGATPAAQPQNSAFGGFGATTPAASSGFGASAFGKSAASPGFGNFGATTAPAATPATGVFGFGATQPQANAATSLFGGTGAAAPASTGFSFGASAPKPASGGFGFGSTGGAGAFGSTTGSAFGATTAPSAFGITPAQTVPGTTSLFGSSGAAAGSTGSFGFGSTPSTAPGSTTSLFGAGKPATTSLFGSTTSLFGSTTGGPTTGLFGGGTSGGSSFFGAPNTASNTGASGFGFGGSGGFGGNSTGGFGGNSTGGFGGFGTTATPAAQAGGFGTTGSLFGQPQQQAQAVVAQPQNLVAAPDINPYGVGSFGAGLVEQNVKAALDLQSIKTGSSASSRLITFADDVGLPRSPLDPPLVTRRQTMSSRHAIPVSFIRGSFKGSKSRFSTFTAPALSRGSRLGSGGDGGAKEDEFKFTSSLFRNSVTKRLVIDKGEQNSAQGTLGSSHVSVVPITDSDGVDVYKIGNNRNRLLKAGDDGKYSVSFCNQTNKKVFSLRLYPNQTVKQVRHEVKLLLRESSASMSSSIVDIELVLKGRILHDDSVIEELQLKEGDSIDVVVIENRAEDKNREDQSVSMSSLAKMPEAQPSDEPVPPKRFMTYDEYLAFAGRDEDNLLKKTEAISTGHSSPASSSCPTLTNDDYYTIPSYERLQVMTDQELSQVDKFTVGCRGLGAVEWIGKTDVRDLDLDELVFFEKKEVIVYKDDGKKHELGKGLNKPAVVELLGIFPPRKSTPEKYKERVKQRTQDIGATFLDYSIDKGIWRFRVEHFSRYGFEDDDDDDDVDMDGLDGAADAHSKDPHIERLSRKSGMIRGSLATRAKIPFCADRSGLFRQSGIYTGDSSRNRDVTSFGGHLAPVVVSDKRVEMRIESESVAPEAQSHINFDVAEEVAGTEKDQRRTSELFPVIPYTLKPLGVDNVNRLPAGEKSTTYQMMLEASNHKYANVVRNYVDGGMFMARSFRCSWGPNGELVNLGKLTSRQEEYSNVESSGRRIRIEFPLRLAKDRKLDLHEGLKLHYDCTLQGRSPNANDFIDREESEAPAQYALPVHEPLMNCLHKYVTYAENRNQKRPTDSFEKLNLLVWKLIQALWGQEHGIKISSQSGSVFCPLAARDDPSALETLDSFQTVDLRREAISQWFEDALSGSEVMTFSDATPSVEGVLHLLCQHRVAEAADMAADCGNLRLATMIAQAASYEGAEFRSLMEAQMAQWNDSGSLEFMDTTLVLVYSVLSGSVEVLSAHNASMSWIACLALFLWYKRGPASPLKSAMALYEDAVSKQRASPSLSQYAVAGTDKNDILMELMILYIEDVASLCRVLSPSGFMTQNLFHLDYELSWHLHSVLRAIGYKLDRQWESHIHQNFIRQLEGSGLWEDAVYVALNISDVTEREDTCRELLFRNADALALSASIREDLCERLNIPAEWISEALALRAIVKQERHEEIAHWIAARHYEEAHACLISHIAMRCLFASEKDALMQLLLELEPMSVYIPLWKSCEKVDTIGGGLLLEYLRLEQQKGLEVGHEDQFLQRVMLLSQQLSSARDASAKDVGKKRGKDALLAQACVSSMLVSLATQAVQLRSLLSYTQERELTDDASSMSAPLELEPEFLSGLSHFVTGRETSFVESYRSSQLMHLCSTFIDWRA